MVPAAARLAMLAGDGATGALSAADVGVLPQAASDNATTTATNQLTAFNVIWPSLGRVEALGTIGGCHAPHRVTHPVDAQGVGRAGDARW